MTRILGIDLGSRRVGIAIAEGDALRARPLATIARGRDAAGDAQAVERIAAASGATEVVVGLPLDMSGTEGPAAAATRGWATELAGRTGLTVTLRDERLSSHVAESRVGPARRGRAGGPPGPTRRAAHRARIDREAAVVILEDELGARAAGSPGERVEREPRSPGERVERPAGSPGERLERGPAAADRPDAPKSGTIARATATGDPTGPGQEPA